MNYDTIIVELLSRIQALEQRVDYLSGLHEKQEAETDEAGPAGTVSTKEIAAYIKELLKTSYENGRAALTIKANDIHRALNLKNRIPMVCNAMRQCMKPGDEVVHETPSGYSSTLEVKYRLPDEETDGQK